MEGLHRSQVYEVSIWTSAPMGMHADITVNDTRLLSLPPLPVKLQLYECLRIVAMRVTA